MNVWKKVVAVVLLVSMIGAMAHVNTGQSFHKTKKSFYMGSSTIKNDEAALDVGQYIDVDEEVFDDALVEYSDEADEPQVIQSLDELYGTPIEKSKISKIAKVEVASYLGKDISDFSHIKSIQLGKPITLLDANDFNTYVAFNFKSDNSKTGYVTVATHTKAPLVKEIKENVILPEKSQKAYYLSDGEFYFQNEKAYLTLENKKILKQEFEQFKKERVAKYYEFTKDLLASIELDTVANLNNMTYLFEGIDNVSDLALGKKYKGQEGSGYGGITSPKKYLKDRYGGTISLKSSKYLSMNSFICNEFKEDNNCSLVAIARVLYYYYNNGYKKLPSSYKKIYNKVLKVAKKYGFTDKKGTNPTKIDNIINRVLDDCGYSKGYSKGIYVWNFNDEVQDEIKKDRPVIMNIARGYYGNHTITVCGYGIYKSKHKILFGSYNKTHHMIGTYDGWSRSKRFIDYEAFAFDLLSSGFGSFNTVIMKK